MVVLVAGSVLAILLGVNGLPAPFLAPPLMATARAANQGISAAGVFGLSVWAWPGRRWRSSATGGSGGEGVS